MAENRLSSISQTDSVEAMGEFWDTHDFTQYDTDAPDVEFTISSSVSIEPDLLAAMEKQARLRGIGVETLVNLWLQEKLVEHNALVAAERITPRRYLLLFCHSPAEHCVVPTGLPRAHLIFHPL